jgi:uncharacterized protein (UPF0276 family)
MLSTRQERIRMLPVLIEREKNLEKVLQLAAELAALLELEMQERRQKATAGKPNHQASSSRK